MSKGEIIDFVVLRIQSELDRYQRTKTIPHSILDGTYDIEEVADLYIDKLTPKYQRLAKKLQKEYYENITDNLDGLKETLRKEYTSVMNNLNTNHDSFYFSEVMNLYRPDMNPVRALYYQTREVIRRYNPEDPHHYWLIDLITDREYNNIICDALAKDLKKLERILKRYYIPITQLDDWVPLELFHARRTVQDYRHFYSFFQDVLHWKPDE
tara:strand:+ start:421 stop:1053 length:633 start_codon:yes stop_codon:yes gene_type:complete